MSGFLNLGSLVLGIIAWVLPVVNLIRHNKADHRGWAVLSAASVGACAVSLCLQILEVNHRVKIMDWSALMDTSPAMAAVAVLLLAVTSILNTLVLAVYYRKQQKG